MHNMEFLDTRTIYILLHIFGTILGVGGAYASDLIFFRSVKDRIISKAEYGFLEMGSRMIWAGLGVLILSGLLLFFLDPSAWLASTKLMIKLTIVSIILLNGLIFHFVHLPVIKKSIGKHYLKNPKFMHRSPLLIASGAISMISWTIVFVLGVLGGVPFTYTEGILIYLGIIAAGVGVGLIFRRHFLG